MTQENATVTVEVTKEYRDIEKLLLFKAGERHEVTEKRAKELVKAGVAQIVGTEVAPVQPEAEEEVGMVEPDAEAEKKPKKATKKTKEE